MPGGLTFIELGELLREAIDSGKATGMTITIYSPKSGPIETDRPRACRLSRKCAEPSRRRQFQNGDCTQVALIRLGEGEAVLQAQYHPLSPTNS